MGMPNANSQRPRLILVGGFLGAGKTTLLSVVSQMLQKQYKSVGLITNDQTTGLVDTQILEMVNSRVREISGSCFCCDFQGFIGAVKFLISHSKCEVVVGEPVGSCTDLSATIMQPVKSMYANSIALAPLSVLIDPLEYLRLVENGEATGQGSAYIYLKQLEEADYIVINKTDLLDEKSLELVKRLLSKQFPEHPVCLISARNQTGVAGWLERICADPNPGRRLAEVDYDVYAAAEARTGWYNGSFLVSGNEGSQVDWSVFHHDFLKLQEKVFLEEKIRINHLKTFLKGGTSHMIGNITGRGEGISIRGNGFYSESARLVVNIRAETSHEVLNEIVEDVLSLYRDHGYTFEAISIHHITPGQPQPSFRYRAIT